MDGVFTVCRITEGCISLEGHDGPCRLSFTLRVRSASDVMREMARRLDAGANPRMVAIALRTVAERFE